MRRGASLRRLDFRNGAADCHCRAPAPTQARGDVPGILIRSTRAAVDADPVPAWKAAVRKAAPLFIVSRVPAGPVSREAFESRISAWQRCALAETTTAGK